MPSKTATVIAGLDLTGINNLESSVLVNSAPVITASVIEDVFTAGGAVSLLHLGLEKRDIFCDADGYQWTIQAESNANPKLLLHKLGDLAPKSFQVEQRTYTTEPESLFLGVCMIPNTAGTKLYIFWSKYVAVAQYDIVMRVFTLAMETWDIINPGGADGHEITIHTAANTKCCFPSVYWDGTSATMYLSDCSSMPVSPHTAAVNLFKSTDTGLTWTKLDDHAMANPAVYNHLYTTQLVMNGTSLGMFYNCFWDTSTGSFYMPITSDAFVTFSQAAAGVATGPAKYRDATGFTAGGNLYFMHQANDVANGILLYKYNATSNTFVQNTTFITGAVNLKSPCCAIGLSSGLIIIVYQATTLHYISGFNDVFGSAVDVPGYSPFWADPQVVTPLCIVKDDLDMFYAFGSIYNPVGGVDWVGVLMETVFLPQDVQMIFTFTGGATKQWRVSADGNVPDGVITDHDISTYTDAQKASVNIILSAAAWEAYDTCRINYLRFVCTMTLTAVTNVAEYIAYTTDVAITDETVPQSRMMPQTGKVKSLELEISGYGDAQINSIAYTIKSEN